MAFRIIDITITILVNDVPNIRMDGANESTVNMTKSWTPVVTCCGSSAGDTEKVTPGADNSDEVSQEVSPNKTRDRTDINRNNLRFFFIIVLFF